MTEPPAIRSQPFAVPTDSALFAAASRIVSILREQHAEALFAGGFVRDMLIGRDIHDVDIATSALPDQVQKLFPGSRAFGKSFGVIQVEMDTYTFEIATFRQDAAYKDGRHPESVTFTTAAEDAQRRDFTINGLFYDPARHVVIDYVDGLKDIEGKNIRAIGNARQRFEEDHLRMLRAIRFASVLDFIIETDTFEAIKLKARDLKSVSHERVYIELTRLFMESRDPGKALDLLRDTETLDVVLPEITELIGVEQPPEFHPEGDVYQHTRLMLQLMTKRTPELIWSILMHDIAKPQTFRLGKDKKGRTRIQFRGHAEKGSDMAVQILKRFRCSNDFIDSVQVAVRNHMKFISVPEMKSSTLRRWAGSPTFELEMELHRIDCLASHGKLDHYHFIREFQTKLAEEPVLPKALLSGKDLIQLGVRPGPHLGKLLKQLYDEQLEGRIRTRDAAVTWVKSRLQSDQ